MRLLRREFWGLLYLFCCVIVYQSHGTPVAEKPTSQGDSTGDKQATKEKESKGTQTIIRPTNVFRTDNPKPEAKGLLSDKDFKRDLRPFEWLYNTLDNYLRCAYSNGADCEKRLVSSVKLGETKNQMQTVTYREIPSTPVQDSIIYSDGGTPYSAYLSGLPADSLRDATSLDWFDKPYSGLWKPAFPMYRREPSRRGSDYGENSFDPFVPMLPSYFGPKGRPSLFSSPRDSRPWMAHRDLEKPFGKPFMTFQYARESNARFIPSEFLERNMRRDMGPGSEHGVYNGLSGGGSDRPPHFYGNPFFFPIMQLPMI